MFCSTVLSAADETGWVWVQAGAVHIPLRSSARRNTPLVVFELRYRPGDQTGTTAPLGTSPSRHAPQGGQGDG